MIFTPEFFSFLGSTQTRNIRIFKQANPKRAAVGLNESSPLPDTCSLLIFPRSLQIACLPARATTGRCHR
jgi:hypothetical protein